MKKIEAYDAFLKRALHVDTNFDVVRREVGIYSKKGILYYLSSLVNESYLSSLLESLYFSLNAKKLDKTLFNGSVQKEEDIQVAIENFFSGVAIFLLEKEEEMLLIDVRTYPSRAVSEPSSEQSIRGSRDGFGESLNANIGLLRRRIKDSHLVFQTFVVSKKSKMQVAVAYLEDEVDRQILDDITRKIKSIDVESLVMSDRALEELLFKQRFTPFPLVRYTERPDVAAINLMHGKILIFVDTSSSVMITPTTFIDHTKHVEEFRQSPFVGTFTRFLRSMAVLLSFLLLPFWLSLVAKDGYANGLHVEVSGASMLQLVVQILIAELIFELLRIASIHTPSQLTSAVGLIAAIVLSQVSLDLGLFLPEIILMCSISAICGFATPSYELSMANKVIQLLLILMTAILGKAGFLLSLLLLFLYLSTLKTWNVPYLYPLCPFDEKKALDLWSRSSAKKRKKL